MVMPTNNATQSKTGGGSDTFSTTSTETGLGSTGSSDSSGFLSNVTSGLGEGIGRVGREVIPIFARQELLDQQNDQLRNPTFDQRSARDRVGDVETTQGTTREPAGSSGRNNIIPGVRNEALLVGALALVSAVIVARSL